MNYYLALMIVIGGLGLALLSIDFLLNLRKEKKLQKIKSLPFDEKYRQYLEKTPHNKNLSIEDKEKIERSILIFIHTKEFMGVHLEVMDEMKVIIAFYACLLLLHIQTDNCYNNLKTIIIYPHIVVTDRIENLGGIYTKEQFLLAGQASNDTVVIIWSEAKSEAYHLGYSNVIIHEFAHEIDFMDGEIDGVPPLEQSKYQEWTHVLFKEFNSLSEVALKDKDWGKYKLLGDYAAINEAEFFAVVTERFFESPHSLKINFPELYYALKSFYKIDAVLLVKN